jgi:hypothetical protein
MNDQPYMDLLKRFEQDGLPEWAVALMVDKAQSVINRLYHAGYLYVTISGAYHITNKGIDALQQYRFHMLTGLHWRALESAREGVTTQDESYAVLDDLIRLDWVAYDRTFEGGIRLFVITDLGRQALDAHQAKEAEETNE